jgi:hypothetical protein
MLVMSAAQPLELTKTSLIIRRLWAMLSVFTLDLRSSQLACYESYKSLSFEQLFGLNLAMLAGILLPALGLLVVSYLLIRRIRPSSALQGKLKDRIKLLFGVWVEVAALPILRYSFEAVGCIQAKDGNWRLGIHLSTLCWKGTHVIVFTVAASIIATFTCLLILLGLGKTARLGGIACASSYSVFDKRGAVLHFAALCLAARTLFSEWYEVQLVAVVAPASLLIVRIAAQFYKGRIKVPQALHALLPASMIIVAVEHYVLNAMPSHALTATGIAATVSVSILAAVLAFIGDSTRRWIKLAASQGLWSALTLCTVLAGPSQTLVEPLPEGLVDAAHGSVRPSVSATNSKQSGSGRDESGSEESHASKHSALVYPLPLKHQWAVPSLSLPHVPIGAAIVEGDELTLEDISDEGGSSDRTVMLIPDFMRAKVVEVRLLPQMVDAPVADVAASEEERAEIQSPKFEPSLEGDRSQSAGSISTTTGSEVSYLSSLNEDNFYLFSASLTSSCASITSSEGSSGAEELRQQHTLLKPVAATAQLHDMLQLPPQIFRTLEEPDEVGPELHRSMSMSAVYGLATSRTNQLKDHSLDEFYGLLYRSEVSTAVSDGAEPMCVVCMERRPTVAIAPCGHRCLCAQDAPRFSAVGAACPICRGAVRSVLAIFDA